MISWRPYRLSLFVARYMHSGCQLCHYHSATLINASNINDSTIDSDIGNLSVLFNRLFNQLFNKGILCQRCHDSIHWLPKPLEVDLSYPVHISSPTAYTDTHLFQSSKSSINHLSTNNLQSNNLQNNNSQGNNSKTNNLQKNVHQNRLVIQPISYYQHPLKQVIQNFKFREDIRMLPILWYAICQLPIPKGCYKGNSVILPMPTTNARIIERGFDPLSIITPYLSKHWQIPIWQGVARVDDTISQRGLSRIERQKNIKGAFAVTESIPVRNVILFDDVATTGSSLQELANTLLSVDNSLHLRAYSLAHGSTIH